MTRETQHLLFWLNKLPRGSRAPTRKNTKWVQEDVCIVVLQYLWEQFRVEVNPYSSAERARVDSNDPSINTSQKSNTPFNKKFSLWQLSYSYLLADICTMSQGRTATKNKHLPPDLLNRSSKSHSLIVPCHLAWSGLVWPALTTLRGKRWCPHANCLICCTHAPNT